MKIKALTPITNKQYSILYNIFVLISLPSSPFDIEVGGSCSGYGSVINVFYNLHTIIIYICCVCVCMCVYWYVNKIV